MRYCTGLSCQHWGEIPANYKELRHTLRCPIDNGYLGPAGYENPISTAGYKESDRVTPKVTVGE